MNFSLIVDIVLAVVALFLIIKFTIKGLVKGILDGLKVFVAIVISFLLRLPVAKIFDGWFMNDRIVGWVENSLLKSIEGNDTFVNFIELYESAPMLYHKFLVSFGLENPESLNGIEGATQDAVREIAVDLGSSISLLLSTVLAVIVVFILSIIALTIVIKIFDLLTKFPVIRTLNRVLGFALGVCVAYFVLWGAVYALEFVVNQFGNMAPEVLNERELNESMVVGFFNTVQINW